MFRGDVDVAIVRGPLVERELDVVPLAMDETVLMVSASHELAHEPQVAVEDILRFRITPALTPDYFLKLLASGRSARRTPRG